MTLTIGQRWQLGELSYEIVTLGKLLVTYRVYKGKAARAAQTSMLNRVEFEQYLKQRKAKLVKKA
jgi:hypothetical protein